MSQSKLRLAISLVVLTGTAVILTSCDGMGGTGGIAIRHRETREASFSNTIIHLTKQATIKVELKLRSMSRSSGPVRAI